MAVATRAPASRLLQSSPEGGGGNQEGRGASERAREGKGRLGRARGWADLMVAEGAWLWHDGHRAMEGTGERGEGSGQKKTSRGNCLTRSYGQKRRRGEGPQANVIRVTFTACQNGGHHVHKCPRCILVTKMLSG
jgi:hypothetical protein